MRNLLSFFTGTTYKNFPLMQTILLNEALQAMESGEDFSITYYSFDKQRKTAGRCIKMEKCVLAERATSSTVSNGSGSGTAGKYQPAHHRNSTRNIQVRGTYNKRKVKIFLITKFNEQAVIW